MPKSKKSRADSGDDSDMVTSGEESESTKYESSSSSDEASSSGSDTSKRQSRKRKDKTGKGSVKSKGSKPTKETSKAKPAKPAKTTKSAEPSPAKKAKPTKSRPPSDDEMVDVKKSSAKKAKPTKPRPPTDYEDDEDEASNDAMTREIIEGYKQRVKKFIKRDNMFGFRKVLAESPVAAVLENLHYMFVASIDNDEMFDELVNINAGFNIVSRKFIKSLRNSRSSRECKQKYAESERVAEGIQNQTPLKEIEGISEYTPEFIVMKTIQAGDTHACNAMMQKWKLAPRFLETKDLIAALYGWEDFLGKKEKVSKTQNLVVHALCGGFSDILRIVSSGSGAKWVLPETLQKAGLVCPVRPDMKAQFKKMLAEGL